MRVVSVVCASLYHIFPPKVDCLCCLKMLFNKICSRLSVAKMHSRRMVLLDFALVVLASHHAMTMTGYDCSYQYKDTRTVSASDVEPCPSYQSWFPQIQPVQTQILRSTEHDQIEVEQCEILVTKVVDFCGKFNSIVYGASYEAETNEHHKMSHEDCRHLVATREMVFRYGDNKNETWHTFGIGGFSREFVTEGDRDEAGNCVGGDFSLGKKHFHQHVLRVQVVGEVKKFKVPYNRRKKAVTINGISQSVVHKYSYNGPSTIIWNDPEDECHDGQDAIYELYRGDGQMFHSNDSGFAPSMMLVKNFQQGSIFGLEVLGEDYLCGHEVYRTNLADIYVSVNESFFNSGLYWEIPNVISTKKDGSQVDALQNVQALLTRNFVAFGEAFSTAIQTIGEAICETKRQISKNSLMMMRLDEDEGILGAFGMGYNSVRRGGVFHVYGCQEIPVVYRPLAVDTKDIPISYEDSMGETQEGYLDVVTRKIKNSTVPQKTSLDMPIGWDFQGTYRCKAGDLVKCDPPKVLPVDFEVLRQELKQRKGDLVLSGSIDNIPEKPKEDDKQRQVDFETIVQHENNIRTKQATLAQEIHEHQYRRVFRSFGMPVFQKKVNNAVDNTGVIGTIVKVLGGLGIGTFLLVALYRVGFLWWSSDHDCTFTNILLAIFLPSKLYTSRVREQVELNTDKLEELKKHSTVIDMEGN